MIERLRQCLARHSPIVVRFTLDFVIRSISQRRPTIRPGTNPLQDGAEAQNIGVFPPAANDLQAGRQSIRAKSTRHRQRWIAALVERIDEGVLAAIEQRIDGLPGLGCNRGGGQGGRHKEVVAFQELLHAAIYAFVFVVTSGLQSLMPDKYPIRTLDISSEMRLGSSAPFPGSPSDHGTSVDGPTRLSIISAASAMV